MSVYVGRAKTAARFAKKAVPVAAELYRRWQSLPPEQRERYMKTVRDYASKAGEAAKTSARKRR
jgi:acyl-CoA reductase-like NAD-dependent aldehyde dehydrogenase